MRLPMRSLTEPPALKNSHLHKISHCTEEEEDGKETEAAVFALVGHAVWLGHDVQVEGCRLTLILTLPQA